VRVLVPITLPDRDLDWAEWDRGGHGPEIGVAAVSAADAVFVPALAVARDGPRLGRGGGSYDRALTRVSSATPRVALLFAGEVLDALPAAAWDVAMSAVVIPSGWVSLE
jgi:5-formyltetrahydrofolate cyclo-ligase